MKKLKEVPQDELDDFSRLCKPLVKYIRKFWNWKGLKPKGYKEFKANYSDYDQDELAIMRAERFDGINDASSCGFSFPFATARHNVCYNDVNQGRDPLNCLIAASVSFGMVIQEERDKRKIERDREKHNLNVDKYSGILTRAWKRVQDAETPEETKQAMKSFSVEMESLSESTSLKVDEWFGQH